MLLSQRPVIGNDLGTILKRLQPCPEFAQEPFHGIEQQPHAGRPAGPPALRHPPQRYQGQTRLVKLLL